MLFVLIGLIPAYSACTGQMHAVHCSFCIGLHSVSYRQSQENGPFRATQAPFLKTPATIWSIQHSLLSATCHVPDSLETLPRACPQQTETNNKTKQKFFCCRRKSTHACRCMHPGETGVKGSCEGDRQNGKAPRSRRKT